LIRFWAGTLLATAIACGPETGAARRGGAATPASSPASDLASNLASNLGGEDRGPAFADPSHRSVYEASSSGLAAIDALRGRTMTSGLSTDLGFKCAGLRQARIALAHEPDAHVTRLVARIDKTCSFDVPLASASFEVALIEKRHAEDPTAAFRAECAGLHLAIADIGSAYLENPKVAGLIAAEASYCGAADSVRVTYPNQ
jgi:hypothetical protein